MINFMEKIQKEIYEGLQKGKLIKGCFVVVDPAAGVHVGTITKVEKSKKPGAEQMITVKYTGTSKTKVYPESKIRRFKDAPKEWGYGD